MPLKRKKLKSSLLCRMIAGGLLCASASLVSGQDAPAAAPSAATAQQPAEQSGGKSSPAKEHLPSANHRRHAMQLFLEGGKIYATGRFEEALKKFEAAALLDPTSKDYAAAVQVARSHAVEALVQESARERIKGNQDGALKKLARAQELDPKSLLVGQHLEQLSGKDSYTDTLPQVTARISDLGAEPEFAPQPERHSFHLRSNGRQVVEQVLKAYGINATVDESVRGSQLHFDLDDADFEAARQALEMTTRSFMVPLDAHRALVAADTKENRQRFERQQLETVYLGGLSEADSTEISNLAKNVFSMQQAVLNKDAGTLTVRAAASVLAAFNATVAQLLDGRNQIQLDVRFIELAHSKTRQTGVQAPQGVQAFNLYTMEQSALSSNASTVSEIISSGLASADDPLAILAILYAAGDLSSSASSILANGFATFGGGITESGLSPGSTTVVFNLNSSDSKLLDQIQMHVTDNENATLRMGTRYPIQTSSYSSMATTSSSIAGLTTAGLSSSLSALYSSYLSSSATIPMVEYQDLGLTLKVTPKVMRSDDVALSVEMKLTTLSGSTLDGDPILNNRAYSSVATLKDGAAVVLASELNKQEAKSLVGTPGLSEIPGLSSGTGDSEKDVSEDTLLIVITPHIVRNTQTPGRTPRLRIERGALESR